MHTITLMALLLGLAGFAALSLAMDRHQEPLLGRTLAGAANRGLQSAGTVLLLLAWAACTAGRTLSVATTVWLGLLTFAAFSVALLLNYRPRALLPTSGLALLAATSIALTLL